MHFERVEVVTSSDGSSLLQFDLACATALNHYTRCTELGKDKQEQGKPSASGNEVCSTGLRVYHGAHVLAAFLAKFGKCLLPSEAEHDTSAGCRPWAVELGCGCGLVGFTTAMLFPHLSVAFTDASKDCLSLVAASAEQLGLALLQVGSDEFVRPLPCSMEGRALLSCELEWGEEGSERLLRVLSHLCSGSHLRRPTRAIRLVLGSDLMYYRVDIRELLTTCKMLLHPGVGNGDGEAHCEEDTDCLSPRFVVLAHFMRIPEGDKKLKSCADKLGFGAVRVPIDTFLEPCVVQSRGWNGTSVILLFLRSLSLGGIRRGTLPADVANRACSTDCEREDLIEAKKLLHGEQFSLLRECLTCYSTAAAEGGVGKPTNEAGDMCDLKILPFAV